MARHVSFLFALLLGGLVMTGAALAGNPENTLFLDLKDGRVVIEMRPDLAPNHVAQIKKLVREGYYDGLKFHRVIDGFMVQGGDNGKGGSGVKLKAEFSDERHLRGVTSMARTSDPNSADAQFFIMLGASPHLDGQYTIWGKVVEGMEFVDMIKKGSSVMNGIVSKPDSITRMRVASDVK